MKKRGQLAIFTISAVILVSIGIFWFVFVELSNKELDPVAVEIRPVRDFVVACMDQATQSGFTRLGTTGGFISVPEHISRNTLAHLRTGPIDELVSPYWWYEGVSAIPDLDFMNAQLTQYVEQETINCLNNFSAFSNSFDIVSTNIAQIDVIFNEEDTTVTLNYPLEILNKQNASERELETFTSTHDIRFKKMVELATKIMETENRDFFFEKKAIDLMTMVPEEIPVTDIEISCEERSWTLNDIHDRMKQLLEANLAYVKLDDDYSNVDSYIELPEGRSTYKDSYFYHHYLWDVESENNGLKAGFTYDSNWPSEMNARPSRDGILQAKGSQGTDILSHLCVNIYHFTYDLTYPVRATVVDDLSQTPYSFSFAFMVSVDHNMPHRSITRTETLETVERISEREFCEREQEELILFTLENHTSDAVANVEMTYTCGRYTCDLGKTEQIGFGAAAGIQTFVPSCTNAILRTHKPGYLDTEQFISGTQDGSSQLVFLQALQEVEVDVIKHDIDELTLPLLLDPDESVSVNIFHEPSGYRDTVVIPSEDESLDLLKGTDFTYTLSSQLFRDGDLVGGSEYEFKVPNRGLGRTSTLQVHVLEHANTDDARIDFFSNIDTYSQAMEAPRLQ